MPSLVTALLAWAAARPEQAIPAAFAAAASIAGAVAATASILNYIMLRRNQEPYVECSISEARVPGWAQVAVVVRNLRPHAIYIGEIEVVRPRGATIYGEHEAWEEKGKRVFVAARDPPRSRAPIKVMLPPAGTQPRRSGVPGRINLVLSTGDTLNRLFYLSFPASRFGNGARRVKLRVHGEIRGPRIKRFRPVIRRKVRLSEENAAAQS